MKRCTYCGQEYSDDVVECEIDGEALEELLPVPVSEEPPTLSLRPPPIPPIAEAAPAPRPKAWTDRQMRIFEVILVCVIAFGVPILTSTLYFLGEVSASEERNATRLISVLHEVAALGLLWYVLMRRAKSFSDLGFRWSAKDVGMSVLLWMGTYAAYYGTYCVLYYAGLVSTTESRASDNAAQVALGAVSAVTILFQFLNPFFEELIVRAYLISELRELTKSVTTAVICSTVLQMSYHFYQGAPLAISYGLAFLILSIYYARTRRITPVILTHLYTDVGATLWYMHQRG